MKYTQWALICSGLDYQRMRTTRSSSKSWECPSVRTLAPLHRSWESRKEKTLSQTKPESCSKNSLSKVSENHESPCLYLFSRGHATQHLALSVGPSVGQSHFWIPSGFRITAPAQPSATGLPCIRPCFLTIYVKHFWVKKILVNLTQKLLIDSKRNADLGQEHR